MIKYKDDGASIWNCLTDLYEDSFASSLKYLLSRVDYVPYQEFKHFEHILLCLVKNSDKYNKRMFHILKIAIQYNHKNLIRYILDNYPQRKYYKNKNILTYIKYEVKDFLTKVNIANIFNEYDANIDITNYPRYGDRNSLKTWDYTTEYVSWADNSITNISNSNYQTSTGIVHNLDTGDWRSFAC